MKEEMNFEDKLARVDEIVSLMEKNTLPLEESLALFKEGNALIHELEETLKEAEKSVQEVIEHEEKE